MIPAKPLDRYVACRIAFSIARHARSCRKIADLPAAQHDRGLRQTMRRFAAEHIRQAVALIVSQPTALDREVSLRVLGGVYRGELG